MDRLLLGVSPSIDQVFCMQIWDFVKYGAFLAEESKLVLLFLQTFVFKRTEIKANILAQR